MKSGLRPLGRIKRLPLAVSAALGPTVAVLLDRGVPEPAEGGRRRFPAATGSALLSAGDWVEAASQLRLSGRELQILRGVFDCRKDTALAADLGIAPRTVATHFERLYRKMKVTNRVALVLRVVETVRAARPGWGVGAGAGAGGLGPRGAGPGA